MGNIDKKKICETCESERNFSRTYKKRNSTQDMKERKNEKKTIGNIDKNRTK